MNVARGGDSLVSYAYVSMTSWQVQWLPSRGNQTRLSSKVRCQSVVLFSVLYSEFFCTLTEVFLTLTEVFPCFFLSCEANARVKLAKTGHGPHSSTLVVICVVPLLFVLFRCCLCCSMYCLCVNVCCHLVTTQLQLINTSSLQLRSSRTWRHVGGWLDG